MYGPLATHTIMYGPIATHTIMHGPVATHTIMYGPISTNSIMYGPKYTQAIPLPRHMIHLIDTCVFVGGGGGLTKLERHMRGGGGDFQTLMRQRMS